MNEQAEHHGERPEMMPDIRTPRYRVPEQQKASALALIQGRRPVNAITYDELGNALGLDDDQVWALITCLWADGEPICPTGGVIRYALDREDAERAWDYLEAQAEQLADEADITDSEGMDTTLRQGDSFEEEGQI